MSECSADGTTLSNSRLSPGPTLRCEIRVRLRVARDIRVRSDIRVGICRLCPDAATSRSPCSTCTSPRHERGYADRGYADRYSTREDARHNVTAQEHRIHRHGTREDARHNVTAQEHRIHRHGTRADARIEENRERMHRYMTGEDMCVWGFHRTVPAGKKGMQAAHHGMMAPS